MADQAEDARDGAAEEQEGEDGGDGDEGENECVFGQTLAAGGTNPDLERHEAHFLVMTFVAQPYELHAYELPMM